MATVYSTIATVQNSGGSKLNPSYLGGKVRVAKGVYAPAEADAAGTVINLVKLPKGARVLAASKLYFEAGQDADLTVKVGDEASDARYLAAVAPGASATSKALEANALNDYVLASEMYIIATTGAKALAVGKKIVFEIFYVLD